MTGDMPITVVIVDDHHLFLAGLAALLDAADRTEVVAQAATAAEALAACGRLRPDVAVVDLDLPDGADLNVIGELTAVSPGTRILVLTTYDDDARVFRAVCAGARGYLLKDARPADVVRAVRAVAHGDAIFGAAVAHRLIDWFSAAADRAVRPFPELTPRERQVLELIAQGLSNPVIALRLGISPKTTRNLVSNVFAKLRVADRSAAIVLAREAGLGDRARTVSAQAACRPAPVGTGRPWSRPPGQAGLAVQAIDATSRARVW